MVRYTKKEKISRWLNYGVAPCFFPVALAIIFDFIASNFSVRTTFIMLSDHFLDIILVSFALAVSIYSSAADLERDIDPKERENYTFMAIVYGVISIIAFSVLYFRQETLPDGAKYIVFALFLVSAKFDIDLGKKIEISTRENTVSTVASKPTR